MPAVSFWVNGVEEDDVLNVRQGPSADTAIVGVIAPLSRGVRISGACVEMWCPVQFNKVGGWVNRSYLVYDVPDAAAANPRSVKFQRASVMSN